MKDTAMTASVLCFSVCPRGNIYFLLGKEADGGHGKVHTWSDFGGRKDKTDATGLDTALRECDEEGMHLIHFTHPDKSFVCKLTIVLGASQPEDRRSLRHSCFLKQVQWCPELPATFARLRQEFLTLRNVSKQLSWILRNKCLHVMDWLVHAPGRHTRMARDIAVADQTVTITYLSGETRTVDAGAHNWAAYAKYLSLLHRMRELHAGLPAAWADHPALTLTRWRGHVVRVRVNRHYLEMQSLRLWSLPLLHDMLRNCRRRGFNTLRECFVPTLRTMLDYMASQFGTHDVALSPTMVLLE